MAIQSGDIKLLASKVMDDVPEGGGGPTSIVIPDGATNSIFRDTSEADRTFGAVHMRQVHPSIVTPDTEAYDGANMIVARPPRDPRVSVSLFYTGESFDTREQAQSRLAAGLFMGPNYPGFLMGNHIAGMNAITLYQRTSTAPVYGETIVLIKREGFPDEHIQYIRVTDVSMREQVFEDTSGEFRRFVVTLSLADYLDADYPGFDVARFDQDSSGVQTKTRIASTINANAAKYYGVQPLQVAAALGSFSVKAASAFTQLVPSAQIEVPIADARTNQVSAGLVAAGGTVTLASGSVFNVAQALFIGGAVLPGSLTLRRSGIELVDHGGKLLSGGAEVGGIDYENGIASLYTAIFGDDASLLEIIYTPAAVPPSINKSQGFAVTAANRSLNYVRTIEPVPTPGSLLISYMASGRWYTLRDNGSAELRGSESGIGSGILNRATGTITVTLGALPDVGSAIIYQWVEPIAAKENELLQLDNDGKFFWPINSNGEVSVEAGGVAWMPGTVSFTWTVGATTYTATDNGVGGISGAANGTVYYARGVAKLSPNVLPPKGTTVNVAVNSVVKSTSSPVLTPVGATLVGNIGTTDVQPGTVQFTLPGQLNFQYSGIGGLPSWMQWGGARGYVIQDNGAGGLQLLVGSTKLAFGTINYATGAFVINSSTALSGAQALPAIAFDTPYIYIPASVNFY